MPQRRQQDPRRMGQLAQYHPGGGDVRSQGRSQGPLTGDPSVTAPTERTAPAQQSPLFAGGPGEPPPQLERAAPVDTQMAGEGLMAPGFGGDTDMQALPAPTEGGKPTSAWSDPGLQAPIPPPIPEPMPPWMPEGAAPPPRPEPPPPPGPPRPRGPQIDWMPGDPGYNPDEGRGLWPPQPVPTTVPPLEGIGHAGSNPGLQAPRGQDRGQQRERDMQRAQRRDARRARPLRA